MKKIRIIGIVNILNGIVVQSINFKKYLPVGNPSIYIDFLNQWGVDEIAIVDIKGSNKKSCEIKNELSKYINRCFVPISAGGGIRNLEDVKKLLGNGADKVIFNTIAYENFNLLNRAANIYGSQAVILSVDIKIENNKIQIYSNSASKKQKIKINDLIKKAHNEGVGEIFINSINKDGSMEGYEHKIIEKINNLTNLPITIVGGMGKPSHIADILKYNVSGIGIGNYFNYIERSVVYTKKYLLKNHLKGIRKTFYTYTNENFDEFERVSKKSDKNLEKGYFVPHAILR